MAKINPKLLDEVFKDVDIPSDQQMARQVAVLKRNERGWYEANSARLANPEYIEKLSSSIKEFYTNNPDFQQKKVKSKKWKENHSKGCQEYLNSPDYVNPKGMLGKKRSEQSKKKSSEKLKGQIKPLEGNKKISEARKGRKPQQESIEKMREKLLGRETGRSRKVQTPAGVFEKLKDAADHYGVSTGSIKNYIQGKPVKDWFKPKLEEQGVKFKQLYPLGFAWLGDADKELGAKAVSTPNGVFLDIRAAAEFYKITPAAVRHRIKAQPNNYFYIT
jgi:hypothetical protein